MKEHMGRRPVSNTNSILSITTARRIVSATIILIVFLSAGSKDMYALAQTTETESGSMHDGKSDDSQSNPTDEMPPVEPPAQREPVIIPETVEPVESWKSEGSLGEKVDWLHMNLFNIAQGQVDKVDSWLEPPQGEQRVTELSRFRVGVFSELKIKEDDSLDLKQVVDFDTDIDLPNLKRRLKLIITTRDPNKLPGRDAIGEQDRSLRTALSKQWASDISTAIGIRARLSSQLFAYAVWSPTWKTENWRLYPQQRFYWDNKNGIGEISTLVFDHWTNRWNTRFSTSIKWSKQDRDADQRAERKDGGFRWSEVFIFDRANELMEEALLGRRVSGNDIAHGWGIRLSAFGGFHFTDEYQTGIFYRRPLRKKWLYLLVEPELKWKHINNWNREWTIRCGIEMLFWGKKER